MQKLINTLVFMALCACNAPSPEKADQDGTQHHGIGPLYYIIPASTRDTVISFDKYCNARYGYCIDFPKAIIFPRPESENGDGRVFENKRGVEILRVFGRNSFDPIDGRVSLEQQYRNDLVGVEEEKGSNDRVITYQKLGKTFFVISGYHKGKIFYQKTIVKDGAFAYAILNYDHNEKATFDKVSERIFKSFK